MFKNRKKLITAFALAAVVLAASLAVGHRFGVLALHGPDDLQVTKVFDGDTIEVSINGKLEKIRFIGVDTPETHKPDHPKQCYGQEASDYTTNLLTGKKVRLEADSYSTNRDIYNRLLRYVYDDNNELVNLNLVSKGLGLAITGFDFSKKAEFVAAEGAARTSKQGLWANCIIQKESGHFRTNDVF